VSSQTLDQLAAAIRELLPLDEPDVERFELLAVALADLGTYDAAMVLFSVLDDTCPLGGIMQSVTNLLQDMSAEALASAFVANLERMPLHSSHSMQNVLRGIVLSEEHRRSLKVRLPHINPAARATLVAHCEEIARFSRYHSPCGNCSNEFVERPERAAAAQQGLAPDKAPRCARFAGSR
jgi:hypothetical protein